MLKSKNEIFGLPNGVFNCQLNRTNEINNRIYQRSKPSHTLEPYYSCRGISTKQSYQPIIDQHKPASVPLLNYLEYDISEIFYPGDSVAPWSGYSTNIDNESILRSQIYPLQHSAQYSYIPESNGDLYVNSLSINNPIQIQETFKSHNPNKFNLGYNIFNNSTREQRLDLCHKKE